MKTCMFCSNTRIFNIHSDYGNNNHTIKDDMLQFFGNQIEGHLRPDDAICNLCMNIMDSVARLKRRLLPLIFRLEPSYIEDHKPINLGKKWEELASKNFDDESDPFMESRSPTPSNLLICKRVVPYESPVEMKIAEIERHRSMSRISVAKSDADSEVMNAFSGKRSRKRKRGHNWTRRKGGRYSSMTTESRTDVYSTYSQRSRPVSGISTLSSRTSVRATSPEIDSPFPQKNNLVYLNGCLQNKRTRSVTRQQEEEFQVYLKLDELHECPEPECTFICEDIDLMAQHKITKHKQLTWFRCNFCGKKYTCNEDLEIHRRSHSKQYQCVICHKEFHYESELLEHWQEHVQKSVPCKYCGKRFLDKYVCNKHQKNVHKRNNPSRIDYDKFTDTSKHKNGEWEVRILVQNTVEKTKS